MKSTFLPYCVLDSAKKKKKDIKFWFNLHYMPCKASLLAILTVRYNIACHRRAISIPKEVAMSAVHFIFHFSTMNRNKLYVSNWFWLFILDLCFPKVGSNYHIHVIYNTIMGIIIINFQLIILWMLRYTYSYSTPTEKEKKGFVQDIFISLSHRSCLSIF